jgi:hypothetical protein
VVGRLGIVVCVVGAIACGPSVAPTPAGSDESGGDVSTSDVAGDSTSADPATSTAAGSSDHGDESSSTGAPPDPCSASSPPSCPDGCTDALVYHVDDLATCAVSSTYECVSGEHVRDPATLHSYYRDDGFVLVGTVCGSYVALDDAWLECRIAEPSDPPGCVCFCREGVCPGDEDYVAFTACAFDDLCPVVEVGAIGPDSGDPVCVLAALRDRTPGVVETRFSNGFVFEHSVVHIDGSDIALVVQATGNDSAQCLDDVSLWTDAQRCTLASPDVFEDCLAETDDELLGICLIASMTWFTSCRPTEPSCE